MALEAVEGEICWAVETSKDGERWRFFGKAWAKPGEPVILHGVPRFVRFRRADADGDWCEPLERDGDHPMTLLRMEERTREELWPGPEHLGLPVLLPGGEEGRLLRFEHSPEGDRWTWALEFRGMHRAT
ncbi:MAG: hypothetical protein HYU54_10540 [Actinobacteria bacterium]|nr:hypothetical protein [Actinomycetota bacterium]